MKEIIRLLKEELKETKADLRAHKDHLKNNIYKDFIIDSQSTYQLKITKIETALQILQS